MDARLESATAPSRKFVAWLADRQAKIAVTGACGWIGRAVVHLALQAGLDPGDGRLRLFGGRPRSLELCGRRLAVEALAGAAPLGEGEWIVLHLAIVGADRVGGDLLAARAANDALLAEVLRLADTGAVRRFVFASSGAAGQPAAGCEPWSYGAMKLAQEARLRDWAAARRRPLLTARVFNLGGPYINHVRRYALGDFIQAARRGGPIEVASDRGVFRSYVHVLELARVLFDQALGEAREIAFDICGREIVEMGDLARTVSGLVGDGPVGIVRPPLRTADPDWYVGSAQAYQAALLGSGAAACDLHKIIGDTAGYLSSTEISLPGRLPRQAHPSTPTSS